MTEESTAVARRPAVDFIAIARLSAHLRRTFAGEIAADPELAALDLRPPTFGVLRVLAATGTSSQRELGDAIGLHPSDVVAVIDDLEGRGWVQRARDPRDRRRYALSLTPDGEAVLSRLEEVAEAAERALLAPLTPAERAQLAVLLDRLLDPSR